jgi:hypothetical protein
MVAQQHEQQKQPERLGNLCALLEEHLLFKMRQVGCRRNKQSLWCRCRLSCASSVGPSPLVVPVDNKHRGSWLKTLNSARSWQMTSLNSAEDHPLTYAVEFKQDARTQLSTHNQTKSAKQCPVQLCYTCRRMKYAEACLGTSATGNRLLTRWQEWCLLLLPQISAHSVSDILCMFWYQMTDL